MPGMRGLPAPRRQRAADPTRVGTVAHPHPQGDLPPVDHPRGDHDRQRRTHHQLPPPAQPLPTTPSRPTGSGTATLQRPRAHGACLSRVPGQLASTVLRGVRRSNAPHLPDRTLRGPVVARKNVCGSGNEDSAGLAATVWTITATAQMAGLNVLTWLTAYLDECAATAGNPSPGQLWNGSCPGAPAPTTSPPGHTTPGSRLTPLRAIHRRQARELSTPAICHARSHDFRVRTTPLPRSRGLS